MLSFYVVISPVQRLKEGNLNLLGWSGITSCADCRDLGAFVIPDTKAVSLLYLRLLHFNYLSLFYGLPHSFWRPLLVNP